MISNKSVAIIAIIVLAAMAGGVYYGVSRSLKNKSGNQAEQAGGDNRSGADWPAGRVELPAQELAKLESFKPEEANSRQYRNDKYGFSFSYPAEMTVSNFKEGEAGEIILAQQAGDRLGFQIFIIPFDEPGPITPERIKQDLPELAIEQPQEAVLTKNRINGLIFFSEESSLGRTREIWFVHNGYLYQVITYAALDSFIAQVMESWEF